MNLAAQLNYSSPEWDFACKLSVHLKNEAQRDSFSRRKVCCSKRKCLVSFKESLSSFLLCSKDKLMSFPLEIATC